MTEQQQYDVAAEVQEHLNRWNPQPDDSGVTHLVGEQSHRDTGLTPLSSSVDAGRPDLYPEAFSGEGQTGLPDVPTDEDGNPQYDQMKNEDLQKHLGARGLPKSGNKDEMVERLEESDAESDDEDDG
jgi:hypothetical protein